MRTNLELAPLWVDDGKFMDLLAGHHSAFDRWTYREYNILNQDVCHAEVLVRAGEVMSSSTEAPSNIPRGSILHLSLMFMNDLPVSKMFAWYLLKISTSRTRPGMLRIYKQTWITFRIGQWKWAFNLTPQNASIVVRVPWLQCDVNELERVQSLITTMAYSFRLVPYENLQASLRFSNRCAAVVI